MKGRVAFVTGAASGIGRASAIHFARRGAAVAVCDIDAAGASAAADEINAAGGRALARTLDVADPKAIEAAVAFTVSQLGRLDFAHNNAGMSGTPYLLENTPADEWNRILQINLSGIFFCMKFQLAQMSKQGAGAIVNTSSTAGLTGTPGLAAYTATKHGVIGLTRTAAVDYAAKGIRVNAICPGTTLTPMLQNLMDVNPESRAALEGAAPMNRLATVDEQAAAAVFLCSDEAGYITGVALPVDGGMTARAGSGTTPE